MFDLQILADVAVLRSISRPHCLRLFLPILTVGCHEVILALLAVGRVLRYLSYSCHRAVSGLYAGIVVPALGRP